MQDSDFSFEFGGDIAALMSALETCRNALAQAISERDAWHEEAHNLYENGVAPEGMVLVPEAEYHGLQKALRIVRDRALQQIEKAEADEHGYRVLYARKECSSNFVFWHIKRQSPYSVKIPLDEASAVIQRDLEDFYGLYKSYTLVNGTIKSGSIISIDYQKYVVNSHEPEYPADYQYIEWLRSTDGKIIRSLDAIGTDHPRYGTYWVKYTALSPV